MELELFRENLPGQIFKAKILEHQKHHGKVKVPKIPQTITKNF